MESKDYTASAIVVAFILVIIITNTIIPTIKINDVITAASTLLAAFMGAWFAYRLQDNAKEREHRKANINAANKALFTVFQQINSLRIFQMDFIDPHRGQPGIFISMSPVMQEDHKDIRYDLDSLNFLLSTKHKQLVLDLFIEQQRFEAAIKSINYRSELHIQQVQPALSRAGIKEGVDYPGEAFVKALGPLLHKTMQRQTEQVIYHVDRTVRSLEEAKSKIRMAFLELFPEGDFLDFELLENKANQPLEPTS
jgi:hypothetical protein